MCVCVCERERVSVCMSMYMHTHTQGTHSTDRQTDRQTHIQETYSTFMTAEGAVCVCVFVCCECVCIIYYYGHTTVCVCVCSSVVCVREREIVCIIYTLWAHRMFMPRARLCFLPDRNSQNVRALVQLLFKGTVPHTFQNLYR